jgi:hypothetical protein
MPLRRYLLLLAFVLAGTAHAAPAPFDLAGPTLEVRVTRGAKTLPISQVPNLVTGDQVWIKADLPPTQSAHYLMVAAFLSGSTNPPPEDWFFPCKTWTGRCAHDGLNVIVPPGAQQVMVFLAPSTSGDFRTLVGAVRGRPGSFVRASQDLNQAELDRSRLDRFLSTVLTYGQTNPTALKDIAPLLARSLSIKVDDKCMDKMPSMQAPCLMQGQESLILNDGHSTSIAETLTSSSFTELFLDASTIPQAGSGYYSPYIASVLDMARIMDSFRTAEYQYIPALASSRIDKLNLTLNAAPSFNDPKSVLVVALPAIAQPQLPPLHAVDPKETYCASRTALVLPVEGAPLVFSTDYAHNITLTLTGSDGKTINLPASADPAQGGYVVDTSGLHDTGLGDTIHATLQGYWGFEPYSGPGFQLRNAHAKSWALASGDEAALIVGRQDTIRLRAESVSCVDGIMLKDPAGKELKAEWKAVNPNELEVKLPLEDVQPGDMTLLVTQYGAGQPQPLSIQTFTDAGHLDSFAIHAGDTQGILKGSRLDEVASLSVGNISFTPGTLSTHNGGDELPMIAQDPQAAAALKQDAPIAAKVTLKDGRVFRLTGSVGAPRPRVLLIGKSVQPSRARGDSNIQLAGKDELPQDATLTFSLRAQVPLKFARGETIEVATMDDSFSASLNLGNGGIRLEDAKVAVATLDPAKAFGPSAFGPLQFRVLDEGVPGDWQPLATLVRLPVLKELLCPTAPDQACKLTGSDLFLVDSVSGDSQFDHPVQVPDGFPGFVLPVPHPIDGRLYVKLRDDPSVINPATLQAQQSSPSANNEASPAAPAAKQNAAQAEHESAAGTSNDPPAGPVSPVASPAEQQQSHPIESVPIPQGGAPGDAASPAGGLHPS